MKKILTVLAAVLFISGCDPVGLYVREENLEKEEVERSQLHWVDIERLIPAESNPGALFVAIGVKRNNQDDTIVLQCPCYLADYQLGSHREYLSILLGVVGETLTLRTIPGASYRVETINYVETKD